MEGGRVNQGFERTNQNANYPENRIQRNLRNDLEAQKRHRENALPINEINVATVTPNFSRNVSEAAVHDSSAGHNDSTWVMPASDRPTSTRTYIEITQEPTGVRLFSIII